VPRAETASADDINVLIVDDHAGNRLAIAAVLEGSGARIYSAASGAEALQCVRERDFVIVLLDVQMPFPDGFETARLIRQNNRAAHLPILFVTAYEHEDESIRLGYSLGAVDFLFKPIVAEVLCAKVSVFVKLARQQKDLLALEERARAQALIKAQQAWETEALRQDMERDKRAAEAMQKKAEELARSVRDLEQARAELTRMNQALEEADRRKNEALAMVAHEVQNPLAAIALSIGLIQKSPQLDGNQRRICEGANQQVHHLNRMVEDLKDVARIQSGQLELQQEPVDIEQVVTRAVEFVRPLILERRHELVVSGQTCVRMVCDPVRLSQMLTNLLTNAARYTDPGGRLELAVLPGDGQVEFRVRDNGRGLSQEDIALIFEPFSRPNGASSGLGLGLALVQRLTALHGGRVSVHSAGEGSGSEFVIALPFESGAAIKPCP
jgi:signal transduction histidine kinase